MNPEFGFDIDYEIEEAAEWTQRAKEYRAQAPELAEVFEELARLCNAKIDIYRRFEAFNKKFRPKMLT
jgi:hypothetical protein